MQYRIPKDGSEFRDKPIGQLEIDLFAASQ